MRNTGKPKSTLILCDSIVCATSRAVLGVYLDWYNKGSMPVEKK